MMQLKEFPPGTGRAPANQFAVGLLCNALQASPPSDEVKAFKCSLFSVYNYHPDTDWTFGCRGHTGMYV
ncbi:hypothetical protein FKM82_007875 [Ascaphus truei]